MSIGYASKLLAVPGTDIKSTTLKNALPERLLDLTRQNLESLDRTIDYNISQDILLFRISSDLIPFGSSEINQTRWWEIFADELLSIGQKVKNSRMRVSLHPGQYTVLNSPSEGVVSRAAGDLVYHTRILDGMGLDSRHKIVLHIGGAYGAREEAMARFRENYVQLPDSVRRRLVIENDDRIFNIFEVLSIGRQMNIPVIYDNLHNRLNPGTPEDVRGEELFSILANDAYWIQQARETWKPEDGPQKIHYSQQAPGKRPGAHSDTIYIDEFLAFHEQVSRTDLDIMLEVKDMNLSAVKCILCTRKDLKVTQLEQEWARYKYAVLERSHADYLALRAFLNNKSSFPATEFYRLIEHALSLEPDAGGVSNAAMHVWGYFKSEATPAEKKSFLAYLEKCRENPASRLALKNFLLRMTKKYGQAYLAASYYFVY